jgi:predicted transcriptional regulator
VNKKDFQESFKSLIDELVDELPISLRLKEFAKKFGTAPATIQKWYDGISAPAKVGRELVIKQLYAEQKKREIMDIVKEVIKNDLRIYVKELGGFYNNDCKITIKLGEETISTGYIDIPMCDCNKNNSCC